MSDAPTKEEINEFYQWQERNYLDLERQGRVRWTGEYRLGLDNKQHKVYREVVKSRRGKPDE